MVSIGHLNPWMSNSYVMRTGGLEVMPTHGKIAVISQVLDICGWYSIKPAYQKDIQGISILNVQGGY
jgi:hypothetical protein